MNTTDFMFRTLIVCHPTKSPSYPFYTVLLAKAAAFFASFPLCVKSGNGLPLPKK